MNTPMKLYLCKSKCVCESMCRCVWMCKGKFLHLSIVHFDEPIREQKCIFGCECISDEQVYIFACEWALVCVCTYKSICEDEVQIHVSTREMHSCWRLSFL